MCILFFVELGFGVVVESFVEGEFAGGRGGCRPWFTGGVGFEWEVVGYFGKSGFVEGRVSELVVDWVGFIEGSKWVVGREFAVDCSRLLLIVVVLVFFEFRRNRSVEEMGRQRECF